MSQEEQSQARIIVFHIDDDGSQLHFTKTFLENMNPNFKVVSFNTFEDLIKNIKEPHDCILSDYQMIKFDGIQICKIIKDIEDKPFILYTAHGSEEVAEKAFETGVDDYIRKELKPSHYQVLGKRVLQAVEKHRSDEKRKEYKNRLEALHKYAFELSSASSLEEIGKKSFEAINKTLKISYANIQLVEGDILKELFTLGNDQVKAKDLRLDGIGVTVRAVHQGKTQIVPDTRMDKDYCAWSIDLPLLSEVVVPILINNKVVGVVNVESEQLNAFSAEDVTLLETLATHIATAYGQLLQVEQLKKTEKKLRNLLDSSNDAAYVMVDTTFKYVNKQGAELLGYDDPSELIGTDSIDVVSPRHKEHVKEAMLSRQRGEKPQSKYEIALLRKDDTEIVVETNASLIEFDGEPASLSFNREITERKEFEIKFSKLYKSSLQLCKAETREEICEILLDAITSIFGFEFGGVALLEEDGLRCSKNVGFKIEEEFLIPRDEKSISMRTVRTGETQLVLDVSQDPDYRFPKCEKKDNRVPVSELTVPIKENGKVLGVINLESLKRYNFTEYETRLIETLAMYSAIALNRLAEREKMERLKIGKPDEILQTIRFASLGKITSMVAHDLRNPLQTIRNSTYFLEKDETGHVDRIIKAVEFADQILEEIKDNTVDTPMNRVRSDLGNLVYSVIEQVNVPKQVDVDISLDEELCFVCIDPVKIRRMLMNLVNNSLEAMPEGGKLGIRAYLERDGFMIKVSDTGEGVSDEVKDLLFSEIITTKPVGSGLGLPFCKRAVESHGGEISLESRKGVGTTVSMFIPQVDQKDSHTDACDTHTDQIEP